MTSPETIERITRSLAYMLRHEPGEFGLELDPYGWGGIDEVLRALEERTGERVEREELEEVVRSGDRPRYEIQGDRIRALYGHSIDILPGEPARPPEFLYVGIDKRDADRALNFGLRGGRRRFLHLAKTVDEARETARRAGREWVILTIFALDAWEEGTNFYDRGALFLAESIPTEFLEMNESGSDGTQPHWREHAGERGERGGRGRRSERFPSRRGRRTERGSEQGEYSHAPARSEERGGHARAGAERESERPRSAREDRPRAEFARREDRPREDRPREDRPREDRPREDRPREDRPREDRPREDRPREDRPREDRPREPRRREETRGEYGGSGRLGRGGSAPMREGARERPRAEGAPREGDAGSGSGDFGSGVFESTPVQRQEPRREPLAEAPRKPASRPAAPPAKGPEDDFGAGVD
jgi:RNA:NAD 2'-phosphotransferase (TPT1/KptA family)